MFDGVPFCFQMGCCLVHKLFKNPRTSLVVQWLRIYLLKQGNKGSIPGPGRSPHTVGQLSPCATTTEATHSRPWALQLEKACMLEWRPSPHLYIYRHTHTKYTESSLIFKFTQLKFCSLTDLVAAAGPKISKGFGDNKKHREKHTPSGFTLSHCSRGHG